MSMSVCRITEIGCEDRHEKESAEMSTMGETSPHIEVVSNIIKFCLHFKDARNRSRNGTCVDFNLRLAIPSEKKHA